MRDDEGGGEVCTEEEKIDKEEKGKEKDVGSWVGEVWFVAVVRNGTGLVIPGMYLLQGHSPKPLLKNKKFHHWAC